MHIMFERALTDEIREKYLILPLDTFYFKSIDTTETAYCVVENTPVTDMMYVDRWQNLHAKLIENYQRQNWKFCEDAIEHLRGRWGGDLDSFYDDLLSRVKNFNLNGVDEGWSPLIIKD